jgi:hypothetical protein
MFLANAVDDDPKAVPERFSDEQWTFGAPYLAPIR